MKAIKRIKKITKIFLLACLFGITYSFFFTTYENIKVNNDIKKFMNRASNTPSETIELNLAVGGTYVREYYKVPRETKKEINSKNVFNDVNKMQLGQFGDIFVTRQSPFPDVFGLHQFMSYYYGGHSVIYVDEDEVLEATGYPDFATESLFDIIFSKGYKGHGYTPTASDSINYWFKPSAGNDYYNNFYRTKIIGLRPTNPFLNSETELDSKLLYEEYLSEAVESGRKKIEDEALYNFLFFLNMRRKYYCTDFTSRSYEEAFQRVVNNNKDYVSKGYAKTMNDDGFITSVNDLILSRDNFMTFYIEINEELIDGENKIIERIYYLEDIKDDSIWI